MNGRHGDNSKIIQLDRIIAAVLKNIYRTCVWYKNKGYNFLEHILGNEIIH